MSAYRYSIVIPVYNSEQTLEEIFLRIKKVFENAGDTFHVIFVEDAGQDNSWNVISSLKNRFPELITAIQLPKNTGQHFATFYGFEFFKGDYIITIDDDLQTPPEEIPKLIQKQLETNADLVYGTYEREKENPFINLCRKIAVKLLKKLYAVENFGSSFRLIRKELVERILPFRQQNILIDSLLIWKTKNIAFKKTLHLPCKKTNYSFLKLVGFFIKLILNHYYLNSKLVL